MSIKEYIPVCRQKQLVPYLGRAALIEGEQIALFWIPNHGVFAIQNWDPIGKAYVLSRGISGDINGVLCVASPLYKQHFCLKTGICLEDDNIKLKVYKVEIENGVVMLSDE